MVGGSLVLQKVLASVALVELGREIVEAARTVAPVHVGSLDAIHVASALSLGQDLVGVATYDGRMQDALKQLRVDVVAPI